MLKRRFQDRLYRYSGCKSSTCLMICSLSAGYVTAEASFVLCFETPDALCFLPALPSCFSEPRRGALRGSTVTDGSVGGGSSLAGIFPHKDCLFCFTRVILVSSVCFFFFFSFHSALLLDCLHHHFFFVSFLTSCVEARPGSLIRRLEGGILYYFVLSSANRLVTSIIKHAC